MRNRRVMMFLFVVMIQLLEASPSPVESKIESVKLFQNRAEIERFTEVELVKGNNRIEVGFLPPDLYDWSLKAGISDEVRILSVEVEKFALSTRRRIEIEKIEKILSDLQDRDRVQLDVLMTVKSQLTFLDGLSSLSAESARQEVIKGAPNSQAWSRTLDFIAMKRVKLYAQKRAVEKKRESLGKEIRKWEYELSKIGGSGYFTAYQSLNKSAYENMSGMKVQQFADMTDIYDKRRKYLETPISDTDYEKRAIIEIYSPRKMKSRLSLKYLVPGTAWNMEYDVRADSKTHALEISVYANLYQKSGENWKNIKLAVSTGVPASSISIPEFYPWFLDVITSKKSDESTEVLKRSFAPKAEMMAADAAIAAEATAPVVRKSGVYMTIDFPSRLSVNSSTKYQKKFIRKYTLVPVDDRTFHYETFPARSEQTYIKTKIMNSTEIPWLRGSAQVFLDNEFMGRMTLPYIPVGEEQEIVLGTVPEIVSQKRLIKRYEKKTGLFGGKRTIEYHYIITLNNRTSERRDMVLLDAFPVSRNREVRIEISELSLPFSIVETESEKMLFEQGLRKWTFTLGAREKREISYKINVSFGKDVDVTGL
ncbi:MAG: DUF4139 domain-containing protein [Spirochaetes bacterium]|jgi:uncharacterized protein (TIGR02231 family)|nr:DUF4139 domain-containing protein [Spirochaetota bacterium]